LEKIDNIDEKTEKQVIEETLNYEEQYIQNSAISDDYCFINIVKDHQHNDK
jgi:hypothetical protein